MTMNPWTLAVDPSSTCTGWAVLELDGTVSSHGTIRPPRRAAVEARVDAMVDGVLDLLARYDPDTIVVEVPSGKVARRMAGHAAGLTLYGYAVGRVVQACRMAAPDAELVQVDEGTWTRGRRKAARAAVVAATVEEYRADDDRGMDAADAIGLGRWWRERGRLEDR